MSHRTEALAIRLEQGAALLTAFVRPLTDREWATQVRDGRTVGVIVHHVATVYPVEVELAAIIGSGKPVTGVTWEFIAEMNAKHARENASATMAETLALLAESSAAAAATIRRFTDAQLDTAASFSLAFDAPMTAQFVLEDHAVRHSWHHLRRLEQALTAPRLTATA